LFVLCRLDAFKEKIENGELTFEEIETNLGHQFKDDYNRICMEMKMLKVEDGVIATRIKQLEKQRKLADCVRGAKTMLEFKDVYKLTGDFGAVEKVALVR